MKSFRKAIAIIIFVIIGFPLCMGGLSAISMHKWIQDGTPWKELVHNERLTAVLKSQELTAFMPEQMTLSGIALNGKAAASSVLKVIDTSLIISTADSAIDGIFRFARDTKGAKTPTWDFAPVKLALKGKAAPIIKEYLLLSGKDSLSEKESKILSMELEKQLLQLPDQMPIFPQNAEISIKSNTVITSSRASIYMTLGAAAILVACAFIGESSWKKRSIFLGATMMVPSMIILLMGFMPLLVSPAGMLKNVMQNPLASYPLTLEYLRYVFTALSSGFRVTGSITVALAVVFMSARFLHTANEDIEA
jgi:hypothetical protein